MDRKLLLVILLATVLPAMALGMPMPVNDWIRQPPPAVELPPERLGQYVGRGWNHMRYASALGRMVLYDGYAELPVFTFENIFANALWLYDPVENRLTLEKLNNWTDQNGPCEPLPENETDPTPWDRHFYSCFVYSPTRNAVTLWAGANRTIVGDMVGETWTYEFATHSWREITGPHPYTVYEQASVYDSDQDAMLLFAGADYQYGAGWYTYALDLATETWSNRSPANSPQPRMGQNMLFDPVRHLTWMFSGAPYGSFGNELWTYEAAANAWSQVPLADPWPSPRRFPHLAWDSLHDVFLMWGGIDSTGALSDTWLFRPGTREWQQLAPAHSPEVPKAYYSTDLDYDPVNDYFVLNQGGTFWLFRYAEPTAGAEVPAAGRELSLRITTPVRSSRAASFTYTLPSAGAAELSIFDVAGRRLDTRDLVDRGAGTHAVEWAVRMHGAPAPSGVYFARLTSGNRAVTRKFTVLR